MKALIAVLSVFVAAAAGAVGGVVVTGSAPAPTTDAAHASGASTANLPGFDSSKLVSRIESLNQEVADLHQEVLRLKENEQRTPVTAAPVKVVEAETNEFATQHRDAILKIIAQDREDLERKKEEERKARDLENTLARADRTAKKLGMDATQQKALADVYILERQKMDDMRNMRGQGDPEAMRTAFQDFRQWRMDELTRRLGADLAQQVSDSDQAGFRGFGGGRGGPGGPGGNGGPGGGPPGGE